MINVNLFIDSIYVIFYFLSFFYKYATPHTAHTSICYELFIKDLCIFYCVVIRRNPKCPTVASPARYVELSYIS